MKNNLLQSAKIMVVVLLSLIPFSIIQSAPQQAVADLNESRLALAFQNLTIAPNPFEDQFIVSYFLSADSEVAIEVYNALGQKVYQVSGSAILQQQGAHQFTITRQWDMSPGIYFLQLTIPGMGSLTRRLIGK